MAYPPQQPNAASVFGPPKLPTPNQPAPPPAPAPPREQYTGQFGAGVDTGAGSAQNATGYAPQIGAADPQFGKNPAILGAPGTDFSPVPVYRMGNGQLTTQSGANGVNFQRVDANGAPVPQKLMTSVGNWENYAPESSAFLGGNPNIPNSPGGTDSFSGRANTALQTQAAGAAMRQAPQINTGATNMIMSGAGQALGQANGTNFLGVANAGNLAGTATGAGYQGEIAAAQQLGRMAIMPAGPSVAEQQLRMGGDAAMQQQMAMASAARGGNAGLALQNAGANQGQIMGNLNAQLGVQRAQEDMANRQFAANAAQAAGGMFGQAAGTQQAGYGAAGQALGTIAGNQVAQANTQAGIGGVYAGLAGQQAQLGLGQQQLNDQTMLASEGMGYDLLNRERAALMQQQQNQANENIAAYGINKGVDAQAALQRSAQNDQWMKELVGGGIAAAGAIAAPFTGGASLAAVPAGVGIASSDIRAKKKIAPADAQVSDAFRAANADAAAIRDARIQYPIGSLGEIASQIGSRIGGTAGAPLNAPAYSYQYKSPTAVGAAPGTHYGPMAQDLERTPAGRSVVVEKPSGEKAIDTGRLALLSASELAKQRAEIDALKGGQTAYDPTAYDLAAYDAPVPPAVAVPPRPDVLAVRRRAPTALVSPANFAQFGVPASVPDLPPYRLGGV
jgi:hypothetical protein